MAYTVGLTGGIGSGKSTVARLFAERGVPVYDTDTIARELVLPGKPALRELAENLGNDIINKNGELDRKALQQRVFNSDELRKKVEDILHPKIRQQLLSNIDTCKAPYCVAVIPLLIEKKWQDVVDRVLVVDVPQEIQLQRAMARDNVSQDLVLQIMKTQATRDARTAVANDIIDNSGDQQLLVSQVNELHEKYISLASNK